MNLPSTLRAAIRRPARVAGLLLLPLALAASAPGALADDVKGVPGGPMQRTREVLQASNRIVTGEGDRNAKLAKLKEQIGRAHV